MPINRPIPLGDTYTQAKRNIGDHPVTYAEDGQQQQAHGAPEDGAHAHLPRQPHRLHHHKGEKGVQAHRRRQGDRQVSRTDPSGYCRKRQSGQVVANTALVSMPATPRICGLTKNDIHHRQERGETGDGFGAHLWVPCSRSLNTRSSRPWPEDWLVCVVDSLSVSERKERENSRLSYTKLRHQARLYGNFFIYFAYIRQRLRRGIEHYENVKLVNMERL